MRLRVHSGTDLQVWHVTVACWLGWSEGNWATSFTLQAQPLSDGSPGVAGLEPWDKTRAKQWLHCGPHTSLPLTPSPTSLLQASRPLSPFLCRGRDRGLWRGWGPSSGLLVIPAVVATQQGPACRTALEQDTQAGGSSPSFGWLPRRQLTGSCPASPLWGQPHLPGVSISWLLSVLFI